MSEQDVRLFRTKPNPDQPDRCPSIDPHDSLQCTRRIHEDDQCHCGGIAWRKGTPRYVDDREKLADLKARIEALAENWGDHPVGHQIRDLLAPRVVRGDGGEGSGE